MKLKENIYLLKQLFNISDSYTIKSKFGWLFGMFCFLYRQSSDFCAHFVVRTAWGESYMQILLEGIHGVTTYTVFCRNSAFAAAKGE